jgi:hypothetical protein
MITGHVLLIYLHILLMVFWIGADIGVFIAGLFFRDPRRSIEARKTVIEAGLVVDALPRLCFVMMGPVGFQLATDLQLFQAPAWAAPAVWIGGLIWAGCALVSILKPFTPLSKATHKVERVFQAAGVVAGGVGLWSLVAGAPIGEPWLAGKLLAWGVCCALIVPLELAFNPVMAAFGQIATTGSTPVLEDSLTRSLYISYVYVIGIYIAVLVAAFLGVSRYS